MSSFGGLEDPQQFKLDVHSLLDMANADLFESKLTRCLGKYHTNKAQQLLKKISLLKHKLAYAYTSKHHFTAGHVSDQRCEGGMSAIKANGKLKEMLIVSAAMLQPRYESVNSGSGHCSTRRDEMLLDQ